MSEPAPTRQGPRCMTLAVYRIAPDGTRTDIVPRHDVIASWLNTPSSRMVLPPCVCPRCIGPKL